MTLVKKQYNGRELPVFENMDEATEHFSKARKTILGVMIIFSACYSFFVAVLLSFSYQLDLGRLILSFIGGFAIYSASCVLIKSPVFAHQNDLGYCIQKKREDG